MVDTSGRAELENCIRNAQNCVSKMNQVISGLSGQETQISKGRQDLERLCGETQTLLKEAQQRCEKLL
ncbi:hypothetical protein [Desulfolucanica intricata]|uniref:hypothetical protein n=1 Tax=Desulfolucanica intricata TaxID=1285191 RepID=UPI000835DD0C|nr:hypothetical protein [Desulfolucanica intricata]